VIMPNHIHLIWMPVKNNSVKNLQLSFMKFTAQKIRFYLQDSHPKYLEEFLVNKKDRAYQIWQRDPLAVALYSPHVIEQKLDYIHYNPCQGKWLLADEPTAYVWSSASKYELEDKKYSFITHYKDISFED